MNKAFYNITDYGAVGEILLPEGVVIQTAAFFMAYQNSR